jgi:Putative lumazine-binding
MTHYSGASTSKKEQPMRKSLLIFSLALLCLASVAAQKPQTSEEHAAVTAVAQSYMDAYYTADVSRMERALHPDFHKRTLKMERGEVRIVEDSTSTMLEGVRSGSGKLIPASERVQKIEVLDIYKNAANVKVVTGRWTDYMLLSKQNGEWRVLDVVLQYGKK